MFAQRLALFLAAVVSLGRVSTALPARQCKKPDATQSLNPSFAPITLQLCAQCPTTTVSALLQMLELTEITVTSSALYCPTSGTYTCPTGKIVPTSVPCYSEWSATCTIERALPYSDYTVATAGSIVTVDTNVYVSGVCIESGSQTWMVTATGINPFSAANSFPAVNSLPASSPASTSSGQLQANSSAAPGYLFPTKSASLAYPEFPLSSSSPNRATWMHDNAAKLKDKTLKSICLPGSHDSATYGLTQEISNLNGQGKYIARFLNSIKVLIILTMSNVEIFR